MNTPNSQFNRVLWMAMVILFVLSVATFNYFNIAADPEHNEWWVIALNTLILSLPLSLLFGAIYVLSVAWREYHQDGQVTPGLAKIIHLAPRIAALLIIFFISLFSLDVFEMQASPLELLAGFLMHNIPSIGMLVLLAFAWKRPAVGFAAFLIAGTLFAVFFVRSIYALPNLLLFVFPILLIAGLFYADWKWTKPLPTMQA